MIPVLESVTVRSSDWGIREALMRTGVDVSSEFVQAIRAFWREHFFSDAFLEHDQIFDGAADYVKLLEILGAQILYVTGRYHHSMRQGTLTQLQKFGFPLKSESQLIMKSGNSADEQFKANQLLELSKMQRPIWLVDNEPVILIEVERSTPHVHFVHMRTTHSGRSHPNPNWRSATPEDYLKITALFKDSSR